MKGKLIVLVLVVTMLVTMLGLMMFVTGSTENTPELLDQYNRTTSQVRRPITVEEISRQIQKEEGGNDFVFPTPTLPDAGTQVDVTSWMSTLDSVHKAWGKAGFIYSQTKHKFKESSGNLIDIRTDCSGYIGYCLVLRGVLREPLSIWSGNSASMLQSAGLQQVSVEDMKNHNYKTGDILVYDGHIEAFVKDQGTEYPIVYNWGGKASVDNKYAGVTDFDSINSQGTSGHSYSTILSAWRFK